MPELPCTPQTSQVVWPVAGRCTQREKQAMSVCRRRRAAEFCRGTCIRWRLQRDTLFIHFILFWGWLFFFLLLPLFPRRSPLSRNPAAIRAFGKEGSRVLKACLHENIFRPLPRCIITHCEWCVSITDPPSTAVFPPKLPLSLPPQHPHTYIQILESCTYTHTHSFSHPPSPWFSFPNPSSFPPPHPPF